GAYMRTQFNNFGVTFANSTNQDFLGDYTSVDEVTISIDVQVEFLNFFGQDVSRPWLVELRDFDTAQGGFPWTSAWFLFDNISQANNDGWSTYSVTFDPNAADLPAGWGGYGAEDPMTFEPILPAGVTFADVLSGVDEIAFTTLQPGFFFGFTDHTIGIDNITISRVPAPSALALLGLCGAVGTRRRR
ncbi:MAG: PEP-CTERM sorting domain-containing protein, partial [Planctomycetota bacterium]